MRAMFPLVFVFGLVAASPVPLSPSTRQTPYDVSDETSNAPSYKYPACDGILESSCGSIGSGLLNNNAASSIPGTIENIADSLNLRVRKRGLLNGLGTDQLTSPAEDLNLLPGQPLQDLGLKRSLSSGKKRHINLGRPIKTVPGLATAAETCTARNTYCCKHTRSYSDPRNAGLLDGALVQDGLINGALVGLSCDLIVGALAPQSCENRMCCTGQRQVKGDATFHLGCSHLRGALIDI